MRDFERPGRSAVFATNGMCATSHPLAAKVAVQILEAGGNAVDAAIAGAVLLGFAEPQSTGIGGDMFALVKPAGEDRIVALNGSGRAPAGIDVARLREKGEAIDLLSADAVTVPGAIDGFCRLSADWGRAGLAPSLAPAIHYAEQGIPVAPRVARDYRVSGATLSGRGAELFLKGGVPLKTGDIFKAPGQAEVLRRVAMDGREAFYEGEVAEDMVTSLQALGGSHSLEDFAATQSTYDDPISGSYKAIELVEHPPNGQGATAILILNILKNFDLGAMDPWGVPRTHVEAEATKLAYDARNRILADPDHTARLEHMLSQDTADRLAALIQMDRALPPTLPGAEGVHKDTVYITVVDGEGMAVSLIYSIFHSFGSGLASDRFGILFQNRGGGAGNAAIAIMVSWGCCRSLKLQKHSLGIRYG